MRFTLRQLQYFVATGEQGSIARASEVTRISQASISAAIAHLEAEFSLRLFLRHAPHGLSLTPAGQRLMQEAKLLLRRAETLYSIADELTNQVRGPITVGWLVTLAPLIAPELCHSFGAGHPAVSLTQVEGNQEQLLEGLRQGALDLAITYDMEIPADISFEPLGSLAPYALLSAAHPLAGREAVGLAELAAEPLILLDLPMSREYFLSLFRAAGLEPLVGNRSAQMETIRTMVANGYGYTLANVMPRSDRALDGKPLAAVALEGRHRALKVGPALSAHQLRPRLLQAFIEHCRVATARIGGLALG